MNSSARLPAAPDVPRLECALEAAGLAWWEMHCTSGAVTFDRRKTDMLGYEPEAFTHYSHFTALMHTDDLQSAMQAMRDHLTGVRTEYRVAYRLRAASGEYRWFEDIGRISQFDETGRPVTVTGIVTDITERRTAEEALASSEERFRHMFHGHAAVKLILNPATGEIVDANAAAADFYGWPVTALKQMRIQQINDLPPEAVQERMTAAAAKANAHFEFRHRRADGSIRDVEVYSNRVELGGRAFLYSIIHDISDRKRAERALIDSEQRFRMLAENVADAVWVLDDETERYRYVSPSIEHIGGYSAEETMSGSVRESMTPESYAALRRLREVRVQEFERGLERTYVDVLECAHRDGSRVTVESHGRFLRNAETGRLEVIGVSRDITERVQVEQAVRAAHDRLRHAEDFAQFGHWEFSLDTRILHASEGAIRIYGFADTDIPLSDVQSRALPEYRPVLDRGLLDLIEQSVPFDHEFRIRRASDGEIVAVRSKAEYDATTRRVFGVVQDVSDRKRIEEERERLIVELQRTIEQVKTLSGIVPICASCKKIRDDRGYWEQVEAYVARHTDARFSHGICPDCLTRLYPDY